MDCAVALQWVEDKPVTHWGLKKIQFSRPQWISLNENLLHLDSNLLKFVPNGPIYN